MIYRNIYVLRYNKMPFYLFKGHDTLYYSGQIKYVKNVPDEYDKKTDLLIDCDCQFSHWRKIEKIFK